MIKVLLFPKYQGKLTQPEAFCPLERSLCGLSDPRKAYLDLFGNVMPCPGVSIAHLAGKNRAKFLEQSFFLPNLIVESLVEKGPLGLAELDEGKNFVQKKGYVNTCHYCFEIRKHLQPFYPVIKNFYQEMT